VPCENRRVIAYLKADECRTVLIVNDLSALAQPAALDLHLYRGRIPVELVGNHAFPPFEQHPYFLSLGPDSIFWFRFDRGPDSPAADGETPSRPRFHNAR